MINVNGFRLIPTIFPDGTSQVWNLPKKITQSKDLQIDWRFEAERELIDIFSLRTLCPSARIHLYMPFLPYGRQDKAVDNKNSFNLNVFGSALKLIIKPAIAETLDAHNPGLAAVYGIKNIEVHHFQQRLIEDIFPDTIVFPDCGAASRYHHRFMPQIIFDKTRNQSNGKIIGHCISKTIGEPTPKADGHYLIIDDICDGGATFIGIAKMIREVLSPKAKVSLFITHGIFSKGLDHLLNGGIDNVFTTDSLPRNSELKGVIKV